MPCTKQQLIASINSYVAARVSNDPMLIQMSAGVLTEFLDSLAFSEAETIEPAESAAEAEE